MARYEKNSKKGGSIREVKGGIEPFKCEDYHA